MCRAIVLLHVNFQRFMFSILTHPFPMFCTLMRHGMRTQCTDTHSWVISIFPIVTFSRWILHHDAAADADDDAAGEMESIIMAIYC